MADSAATMDAGSSMADAIAGDMPSTAAPGTALNLPPPYQLLGHESLFNYFGLVKWSKAYAKNPVTRTYDSILRAAHLPLLSGPVSVDETPIMRDPNTSLVTFAFQQPPPPLEDRRISDRIKSTVLSLTSAASRNNRDAGPLTLGQRKTARKALTELLESRAALLAEEERRAKKEKKARKRAAEAATAAANAPAASSAGPNAPLAISTSSSDNKFVVSGIGKKRKADDSNTGAPAGTAAAGEDERKKVRTNRITLHSDYWSRFWEVISHHALFFDDLNACCCPIVQTAQKKKKKDDLVV